MGLCIFCMFYYFTSYAMNQCEPAVRKILIEPAKDCDELPCSSKDVESQISWSEVGVVDHLSPYEKKNLLELIKDPEKRKDINSYAEAHLLVPIARHFKLEQAVISNLQKWVSDFKSDEVNDSYGAQAVLHGKGLRTIVHLYLNSCYKNLSTLILSKNKLKCFNLKLLTKCISALEWLDVSYNDISKLRGCMLEGMPQNFYLNLSGNKISSIGSNVKSIIKSLRDKNVRLVMYDTSLNEEVLSSLESSISRSSLVHLVTKIGGIAFGVLLGGSGIVCKAFAGSSASVDESSTMLSSSGSLSQNLNQEFNTLDCLGGICLVLSPFVSLGTFVYGYLQHENHQSRLYWRNEP